MRIDVFLYENGYAESRNKAQTMLFAGRVLVGGVTVNKPSFDVGEECEIRIIPAEHEYVGRGALKLEQAISAFGICVRDTVALDIGASTGGFTQVLLEHGAMKVYAVDVGRGQLHESLKKDTRVISLEGVNARSMTSKLIPEPCDIAVMDVSFISQTYILPQIYPLIKENAPIISLVKPQFEAGRGALSKGVVRDAGDRYSALAKVTSFAREIGFGAAGAICSPVTGGDGNKEYLLCLVKGSKQQIEDSYLRALARE